MTPQQLLAIEVAQFALDLVGIADPTGVADGLSAIISLCRGQFGDAVVSGISLFPYIGDLAKATKIPKYIHAVAEAIKLAAKDHKFAREMRPLFEKLLGLLDRIPLNKFSGIVQQQIKQLKLDIEAFLKRRMYNPNPKHELSGALGVKGTRLDLSADQAYQLLNDSTRCRAIPGKKQFVGVSDGKIYVFQPDGAGAFHAYPSTGKEIAEKYSMVAPDIAAMLGVNFKRLSRME